MKIQHNIAALSAYRSYAKNTGSVAENLERLSSGFRINRARDDAAGLAISEKMRAQITGLNQAQMNAQDGISLIQTAEGALGEVHAMLNRMVELADQSANGTYKNEVDRENLQEEITALRSEIDRIAESTNFNGIPLLDGSIRGAGGTGGTGGAGGIINMNSVYHGIRLDCSMGGSHSGTGNVNGNLLITADNTVADNTIEVEIDNAGSVLVSLGSATQDCNYNTKAIEAKVRAEAAKVLRDPTATDQQKATAEAMQTFTIKQNTTLLADRAATGVTQPSMAFRIQGGGGNAGAGGLELQIGDTSDAFNRLVVELADMHAAALGIDAISIETQDNANNAIDVIKEAIDTVSSVRGTLGATQNRLEHTLTSLSVTVENMTAAESRIRDVDIAREMMTYTKNNILVQSAQAMLAQANQTPQGVLQLLQ